MNTDERKTQSQPSLESLMEAYQLSDEQAFSQLVERLSPKLRYFFLGPSVTRRQADDLVQICWMRVHQARHSYQAGRPLLPWIYAIARNARSDEYRRMTRVEAHQEFDGDSFADPMSLVRATEARNVFRVLMTSLPARQREVVVLLKVRGMTLEEAARARDSTIGATKQMAHRAYTNLRAMARTLDEARVSRAAVARAPEFRPAQLA